MGSAHEAKDAPRGAERLFQLRVAECDLDDDLKLLETDGKCELQSV